TSDGSALAGLDYRRTSGSLTFAAGKTSKTFVVRLIDNSRKESTERMWLRLSRPTGGAKLGTPLRASLTIFDNDTPPRAAAALLVASSQNQMSTRLWWEEMLRSVW